MADPCVMTSETLGQATEGPLKLEVFGAKELCIEADGNANLAPYTATIKVQNISNADVTIGYTLDPLRAFRAVQVIPQSRPDEALGFTDCCGDAGLPGALSKVLAPGETLLISSWTRHHDVIWSRDNPAGKMLSGAISQDYLVRFDLTLTYDQGRGPVALSRMFDITLRAMPVVLEDN